MNKLYNGWDSRNGFRWVYLGDDLPAGEYIHVEISEEDEETYSVLYVPYYGKDNSQYLQKNGNRAEWKTVSTAKKHAKKWLAELFPDCPDCNEGHTHDSCDICEGNGVLESGEDCIDCDSTGFEKCEECNGTGEAQS